MRYLMIFLQLFVFINIQAQDMKITKNGEIEEIYFDRSKACNAETVFLIVEEMPEFIGGEKELEKELNSLIDFDKNVKEEFSIHFTINCEGLVFGILKSKFQNSIYFEELQRQIIDIQNWKPGKHRGLETDCFYALRFKIKRGKLKII